MDLFKQGMKGPARPAPPVPGFQVNRYSPVSNWNDDPFGADVFEPLPQCVQKKKPPPRPPPPKLNTRSHPEVPAKPTHFARRPTVLSTIMSRKNKPVTSHMNGNTVITHTTSEVTSVTDFSNEIDTNRMFPKCEPKSVQTTTLIDFSSPPSSPTFTTRSSSDGVSVDSFGSDATTSTYHQHATNGGNASQAESGFEDDFDLFLHSRKTINREDTLGDFNNLDPFSPPAVNKPPVMKKPAVNRDILDLCNGKSSQGVILPSKGPTIIRAKPARPKPPDNTAILKSAFGNNLTFPVMNVNTTTPLQKMGNGFVNNFDSKPLSWDEDSSPERKSSPPMPSIPPPPPPQLDDEEEAAPAWSQSSSMVQPASRISYGFEDPDREEPYAIALFDYITDHQEDLTFTANTKIKLIRRENKEWLFGSLRSGAQGLFPASFVEIKVPLPNEIISAPSILGTATVLYEFEATQPGDLNLVPGDKVSVMYKLNDEWYYGEHNGVKGQFPANYVQFN